MNRTVFHRQDLAWEPRFQPLGRDHHHNTPGVPLAGTVIVPPSDGNFDMVALSGRVQVVTQAVIDLSPNYPPDPVTKHT